MLKKLSQFFVGFALLSPLIITRELYFPFITGKVLFFHLFIELALLAFAGHLLFSSEREIEWRSLLARLKHPLTIAVSFFTLAFVISSLVALGPEQAFWSNFERGEGAFQILHLYVFFLLLLALFQKTKDFGLLFFVSLIGAFFASVYGFLQSPGLPLPSGSDVIAISSRASGTLGNASYLAAYILFAYAFGAWIFLKSKSFFFRLLLAALAVFELIILFKTGTRGAFLGLLAGIFIVLIAQLFDSERSQKAKKILLSIVLLSVLLSSSYLVFRHAPFWEKIPVLGRQLHFEGAVNSFEPRIWTWKSALAGALERPWLGWGAENFAFVFDKYYNPNHFGKESFFDRSHNIFLEYLISGGIVLLLAWITMLFFAIRSIFRRKRKDIWFAILLGLIGAYLVQGFFLFDVLVVYLQLFLLFAYLVSAQYFSEEEIFSFSFKRLLSLLIIGLLFLLNLLFFSSFLFFALLFTTVGFTIFTQFERSPGRYRFELLPLLSFLLFFLISAFLIYSTIYKPLKKNLLLTQAIMEAQHFEKIEKYEKALRYPSPVGQEEIINSIQQFILEFETQVISNRSEIDRESLRRTINFANRSYDSFSQPYIGLRNTYLNGAINLRGGANFGQEDYLQRGKRMFEDSLKIAPTRIEFIELLIQISIFEQEKERYEELLGMAQALRPDINWPEYQEL